MTNSVGLGDLAEGVGAQRECQFGSKGSIKTRETVTEWVPDQKMVVDVDRTEKQLLKHATMTFTLTDNGDTTRFRMSYDPELKGGPLSSLYAPLLGRAFKKGFNAFINDMEAAAMAQTASSASR